MKYSISALAFAVTVVFAAPTPDVAVERSVDNTNFPPPIWHGPHYYRTKDEAGVEKRCNVHTGDGCPWHGPSYYKAEAEDGTVDKRDEQWKRCTGDDCPWRHAGGRDYYNVKSVREADAVVERSTDSLPPPTWHAIRYYLVKDEAGVEKRCNWQTGQGCPWHGPSYYKTVDERDGVEKRSEEWKRCNGDQCPWQGAGRNYYRTKEQAEAEMTEVEKRSCSNDPEQCPWHGVGAKNYYKVAEEEAEGSVEKRCRGDDCPWRGGKSYYKKAAEADEGKAEKRCTGELCPWHGIGAGRNYYAKAADAEAAENSDNEKRCVGDNCPWPGARYYKAKEDAEAESDVEKRCGVEGCPPHIWASANHYYAKASDAQEANEKRDAEKRCGVEGCPPHIWASANHYYAKAAEANAE